MPRIDKTRRTGLRYRINLSIIVPAIFSGLSILSFIIAPYTSGSYRLLNGAGIAILTFLCGFLVIRLMLKPVKQFVKETEQWPSFRDTVAEKRQKTDDDIEHYGQVLREATDILGRVESERLFRKWSVRVRSYGGYSARSSRLHRLTRQCLSWVKAVRGKNWLPQASTGTAFAQTGPS